MPSTLPHPYARRHWITLISALCLGATALPAVAQSYPNKAVKLIVPYPPGGPTDIVARLVGQKLQDQTGQPFLIENRPGAGGNLGAEAVARSAPDGYTLLIATTAHAINPALFSKMTYQMLSDFTPVSQLTSGPLVIVAAPQLPANNVKELVALAKQRKDPLNFASSGNGQSTHLSAELFNTMAGTKMVHVPYKGSAPALTDVMAGQADLMFDTMLSAMPHVRGGKLKALAVTSAQRSPAAPDIPTVAEAGLPGYEAIAWNGLLAPAGTPQAVLDKLNDELQKALGNAEVKEKFAAQGFTAAWNKPKDFGNFLQSEVTKWAGVVKASGAKLD